MNTHNGLHTSSLERTFFVTLLSDVVGTTCTRARRGPSKCLRSWTQHDLSNLKTTMQSNPHFQGQRKWQKSQSRHFQWQFVQFPWRGWHSQVASLGSKNQRPVSSWCLSAMCSMSYIEEIYGNICIYARIMFVYIYILYIHHIQYTS